IRSIDACRWLTRSSPAGPLHSRVQHGKPGSSQAAFAVDVQGELIRFVTGCAAALLPEHHLEIGGIQPWTEPQPREINRKAIASRRQIFESQIGTLLAQ